MQERRRQIDFFLGRRQNVAINQAVQLPIVQMVGEVCAILVNQALLNHIGSRVDQCIQEVSCLLVGDNDDSVGIGCQ